jgi:hypothetical protein
MRDKQRLYVASIKNSGILDAEVNGSPDEIRYAVANKKMPVQLQLCVHWFCISKLCLFSNNLDHRSG